MELTPLMKKVVETAYGIALSRGEVAVVHLTEDGFRLEYEPMAGIPRELIPATVSA